MRHSLSWVMVGVALALALWLGVAVAADKGMTTGPFVQAERIEKELRPGVSTKGDVERLLGKPNGSGSSWFPRQPAPRELWFYQDSETGNLAVGGSAGGVMDVHADMRQQILLIFFDGDLFAGYMWWLDVGAAVGKAKVP